MNSKCSYNRTMSGDTLLTSLVAGHRDNETFLGMWSRYQSSKLGALSLEQFAIACIHVLAHTCPECKS